MSTVSQIILDAFRQSNLLALGVSPTALEEEEALRHLNRIVDSVFGYEVGEEYQTLELPEVPGSTNPWPLSFPHQSVRLMCSLTAPTTVHLPAGPADGTRFSVVDVAKNFDTTSLTIEGNGRLIDDVSSVTLTQAGASVEWFYRDDIGTWTQWSPLELTDKFPFESSFDPYFISMLAMSINPSYGISINEQSLMLMNRAKSQFRSRYTTSRSISPEMGVVFMANVTSSRPSAYWAMGSSFLRGE